MELRRLTRDDIPDLLSTINGAFADYIVPFQLNAEQLQFKMTTEDILPEYSIGIFESGKMIACIMHGLRDTDGKLVAYNAGTGVLPEWRGKGLVSRMYDHVLPFLQEQKVRQIVLEVIETNQSAIRAYEKYGFTKQRKLLCFDGTLEVGPDAGIYRIEPLDYLDWERLQSFWDIMPAWQSAAATMVHIQPKALGAFAGKQLIGYILFNPVNKRLYQLTVAPEFRQKGVATQLLAHVQQELAQQKVQWNNVDEAAVGLRIFLEQHGLVNTINQFEMSKML